MINENINGTGRVDSQFLALSACASLIDIRPMIFRV